MKGFRIVCLALLAAPWLPAGPALAERGGGFDRFQIIIDRQPFGAIPVAPQPTPGATDPDPMPVDEGPPLQETIKLQMLTRYGGVPAAGFSDAESGRSFYLFEGQSIDEYTLLEADVALGVVRLRKGAREVELSLAGAGSATSGAPAAPETPARPAAEVPPAVLAARQRRTEEADGTLSYRELQRQRYEEARRRREEETTRIVEQATRRSDEERLEQLRRVEFERMRRGEAPLIPITLTPEEAAQLEREGWDVSGAQAGGEDPAE